jgi:17beta-estradiol 17-dehydrogenase / 3beta-hydroxysteroid 3-dehydrogenase
VRAAAIERWLGRVALVTGASSGIGRAVAGALCADGMKVVATARREDRLSELAGEAEGMGGELLTVQADLRDDSHIDRLFSVVRERFGGVDVLVNNAGLGRRAPLMTGPAEDWREMLDVNVFALCLCTKEAVADMRRRGDDGHVIHVSSMGGHRVPQGGGMYAATKFAVRALTESLRLELREARSDIRVSAISPGFVETEFAEVFNRDPAAAAATYDRFPVLQPEDVADMVRFVLSSPAHVQVHDLLVRPTRQPS